MERTLDRTAGRAASTMDRTKAEIRRANELLDETANLVIPAEAASGSPVEGGRARPRRPGQMTLQKASRTSVSAAETSSEPTSPT
jgi:hypothetical protein